MTVNNPTPTPGTVLIVYASVRGSTAGIAEFIGERLLRNGLDVQIASVAQDPDPTGFAAVILGSAVYDLAFLPEFERYVDRHLLAFRLRPTWLFSVGMGPVMRGPLGFWLRYVTPRRVDRVRDQLCALDFHPFAGVFPAPRTRFARVLARLAGCEFGDHRDWRAIGAWTDHIAAGCRAERITAAMPR